MRSRCSSRAHCASSRSTLMSPDPEAPGVTRLYANLFDDPGTTVSANPGPEAASPATRYVPRVPTGVGAIAAVLLVAIVATLLFRGGFGGLGAPDPDAQLELHSVSMVSPDEGWAVGGQAWNTGRDDKGSGTTVL